MEREKVEWAKKCYIETDKIKVALKLIALRYKYVISFLQKMKILLKAASIIFDCTDKNDVKVME